MNNDLGDPLSQMSVSIPALLVSIPALLVVSIHALPISIHALLVIPAILPLIPALVVLIAALPVTIDGKSIDALTAYFSHNSSQIFPKNDVKIVQNFHKNA